MLKIERPEMRNKRGYVTLFIPESVARRKQRSYQVEDSGLNRAVTVAQRATRDAQLAMCGIVVRMSGHSDTVELSGQGYIEFRDTETPASYSVMADKQCRVLAVSLTDTDFKTPEQDTSPIYLHP